MQENRAGSVEALRLSFKQALKLDVCCPLCGGEKTSSLTNLDRHNLGLNVVACRWCGIGMISPRPESNWFDEFYQNKYWPIYISSRFKDLDEMYAGDRCAERADQIFSAITPNLLQAPSTYLDIGCGQGGMLVEFRKRYPTAKYFGVERSAHAAEFCLRRHGINIDVAHWNTLEADELSGPFDLITLNHVLEHAVDPVGILTRAVQRMSDRSRIYVEVPDLLSDRWSGKDFFHIAHVWYFHEIALRNLFFRCGLDVVSVTRGAAQVWPWAIGFVGKKSANGSQPSENVPVAPRGFKFQLRQHLIGRQVSVAQKAVPRWIKASAHRIIRKYTSVRVDEIQALERRLEAAEKLVEFIAADDTGRWLYQNRLERMDATLDIFDPQRREFHLDRYWFAAQWVKARRVLDCACGTGYGVRMLREAGSATFVVGVDIERKATEYARKKHNVEATAFICSSADCLALPNASFDVVTSFETIEHVPDDTALIEEFYRVLRVDGILIISTPNQWPLADTPHHVREYNRGSFLEVLEPRFNCIELYNQNSGSDVPFNHGQPRGIVATTSDNERFAECYIAVCRRRNSKDRNLP